MAALPATSAGSNTSAHSSSDGQCDGAIGSSYTKSFAILSKVPTRALRCMAHRLRNFGSRHAFGDLSHSRKITI